MKVSWDYSSQYMESHKIPWFQSPSTSASFCLENHLFLPVFHRCFHLSDHEKSPKNRRGTQRRLLQDLLHDAALAA
jgi:hypothetical protein